MPKPYPRGSTFVDSTFGYVFEKVINHSKFGTGWVRQHHLAWWRKYRRRVPIGYELHHIDADKRNNDPSNLVMVTRAEHRRLHTGAKRSEETCLRLSISAKLRCTPDWKQAVSERVKQQHADGKFGRKSKHARNQCN